ncbi:MAG: phosphatase PAP2 family protein [Candidatus Dormibacteraeota bacterium]|nr:phosphatase PAP2 family protein [Candidatus Dormibacteraeota bacterium]
MIPAARRAVAVCGVLALVFVLQSILVATGQTDLADIHTAAGMERIWVPALGHVSQGIAVLGGLEATTLVILVLLVVLWRTGLRREAWGLLAFPLVLGIELLYKHVIGQNPPHAPYVHPDGPSLTMLLPGHTTLQGGYSFPSGHVVRAVVAYGLAAFIVRRLAPAGWWQAWAIPAAAVVVALVAFDRLYLGVHWQSDVLGGLLLGGVGLSAAIVWLEWGALRR